MRILLLLPATMIAGCTLGEATGLYDLPEGAADSLSATGYPELLTQEQIAQRGIAPLDAEGRAAEGAAAAALDARATELIARQAADLEARAVALRGAADTLPASQPGLSAAGRALLARAARVRARRS